MQGVVNIICGVDEREMRQCLRKVPGLPANERIVLLGEQPNIVGNTGDTLEQLARLRNVAEQDVRIGEPESAGKKCAFHRFNLAGTLLTRIVTEHEPVAHQVLLYRGDGALNPGIVRR